MGEGERKGDRKWSRKRERFTAGGGGYGEGERGAGGEGGREGDVVRKQLTAVEQRRGGG